MKKALPVFVVLALLASGCKVEVSDTTPPANPSEVSLVPIANDLKISWKTPGDSDFDGVEILHETSNSKSSKIKVSSERNTNQSILIENIDKEILNKFTLFSVDTSGNRSSGITKTYGMDTNPPAPVSDVTISEDDSKITVSWKNPSDEDFVQTVVSVKYPGLDELKFSVQGTQNSVSTLPLPKALAGEYTFSLTALDSSGNESSSVEKNYTVEQSIEPDTTAPEKPLEVTATPSTDSIKISWKNPQDTDFFSTEIKINDQAPVTISGLPNESKSYTFEKLSEETEYTFKLYSVDYSLNKSEPEKISATTISSQIIKTEKQTVSFSNTDASFTMIDISFTDGRTEDTIILGEDLLEVPYQTNVKPFRLAMYETSYNTWYEVLKWAESNGYTIVNKGSEGQYGGIGSETNMNPGGEGAEPKLVEMPVTSLTWRDAMIWCNALSEMQDRTPVYYTDADFKTPLRDSTGPSSTKLEDYLIEPGQVDNPYVNTNADGFRLPYVKEWEYAARKRTDATAISGRNVSGDDTGAMFSPTAIEQMNGIDYPISTIYGNYIWWRKTSSGGVSKTASGLDDTTATLQKLTGNSAIGSFRTHLSGGKLPNHLGFYDMSGNVPEWCFDYNTTYGSTYQFHTMRAFRGGDQVNESYSGNPTHCSGNKGGQIVGIKGGGFRIAQNAE